MNQDSGGCNVKLKKTDVQARHWRPTTFIFAKTSRQQNKSEKGLLTSSEDTSYLDKKKEWVYNE